MSKCLPAPERQDGPNTGLHPVQVEERTRSATYWSWQLDGIRLIMCLLHDDLLPKFANMEYVMQREQLDAGQSDKKLFWEEVHTKFFHLTWKPATLFTSGDHADSIVTKHCTAAMP